VGIQDTDYYQILKGLEEGEEVVSAPYRAISKKLKNKQEVEKVDKDKLFETKEE
jgi:HlyD family secretion protein